MSAGASIHVETITPPEGHSFRMLRWRDNLHDVEQFDAAGRPRPFEGAGDHWHLHREMELTLVEKGSGLRLVGDHMERFSGPELELLGPHLPHCIRGLRNSRGYSVQFHWPLEHPLRALPEFAHLAPLWEHARRGLIFGAAACRRVGPRLKAMPGLGPAARIGVLLQVLADLVAHLPREARSLSRMPFSVREGDRHQAGIERVIRRVLEAYAEPMSLREALRLSGMSKAGFERQFPRYTGSTLTEFVNRVRLNHARRLLLGGDDTVGAIAYAVGFNHLSYFNRLYRRFYGASPTGDRARNVRRP